VQLPLQELSVKPGVAPYLPLGHNEQVEAPRKEKLPCWQGTQVVIEEAPKVELAVPAGQGVGLMEDNGQ
jgi:hypothetical protein